MTQSKACSLPVSVVSIFRTARIFTLICHACFRVDIGRTNAAGGVTMVIFKMVFSGRSLDRCSSYNPILFAHLATQSWLNTCLNTTAQSQEIP